MPEESWIRLRVLLLTGAFLVFAPGVCWTPASAQGVEEKKPPTVAGLAAKADREVKEGRIFDAINTLEAAVQADPSRTDLRLHLAALEKQRGMWLRSAEQYKAVLAANPANVDAVLGYGELLLSEYQFRAAAQQFNAALGMKLEPMERDHALVGLGNAQYAVGDYKEAINTYRLLLARKPDEPTALAFMNIALRKSGDLDGAIEGWRRFLQKQPDIARAKVHLAEAEQTRAAIVRQKAAAEADPNSAAEQIKLGELLRTQPDLEGAVLAFKAALASRPDDLSIRMSLGAVLRDMGRLREAIEQYTAATHDEALGPLASHNLAYCAHKLGDSRMEVTAWRAALGMNPRDAYAYRSYLAALSRTGEAAEEGRLLTRAIQENPTDPLPRIEYALLARAGGAGDESTFALLDALAIEPNDPYAQSELRAALALKPDDGARILAKIEAAGAKTGDNAAAAIRKASVLGALGREKEAEPLLAKAVADHPGDARIAVALALSRRALGRPLGAVESELLRARDLDPGYFYAHFGLTMSYLAESRFQEAAVEAEQARRISPSNTLALSALGAALRGIGGEDNLPKARNVLRRAADLDPMDSSGATRFLLAKVAWQLGREGEATAALKGDLPVEPEEMYRSAWESVRDNYFDRTFNGQDWMSWKNRFAGQLETESDALSAIALMLASLDNRDTRLRSADQTATLFFTERSAGIQRDSIGRNVSTSRTVETSTLEGNVGYLAVSNMADPKLVPEVRKAMGDMKEKDAVILDLRGNPGGAEKDVEQITSMLVKPGTPTGSIVGPSGTARTEIHGDEAPVIPDKPVVVLVDRNTGSSAEALAGALKESKRAVIVGEPTYGKAGIQFPRLLPDGTTLLVAVAESANLTGEPYSGTGIQPDVRVDRAMPASSEAEDAAIAKAKEILGKNRTRRRLAPAPAPQP